MADLSAPLLAADNHNILANGTSWTAPETWTNKLGNAGKYIATSIISGANSYYNTAAAVGKWAGLGTEQQDTYALINRMDSDWGQYYKQNKESVDVGGFVIGSIVPGLAGAKLVNLGQVALKGAVESGVITGNMARATGLLVSQRALHLQNSKDLIQGSLVAQKLMNVHTLKALGSGVYQNTLEAAAGEIFATAAMYKSPVLEDMSIGDIAKNVVTGAALGGVIGGAFSAAGAVGQLRGAQRLEDRFRLPWQARSQIVDAVPAADKAITLSHDLDNLQRPIRLTSADAAEDSRLAAQYEKTQTLYHTRVQKDLNDIRSQFHVMAGQEAVVANMLADISTPLRLQDGTLAQGFSDSVFQSLSGAKHVALAKTSTPLEEAVRKATKAGIEPPSVAARFVKLTGEDVGSVTDEIPEVLGLGDVFSSMKHITNAVRAEKFKPGDMFDGAALTGKDAYLLAEKRMVWAVHSKMLKEIPAGTTINATDIPLLTRALIDGNLDINIARGVGPSLEVIKPASVTELQNIIKEAKIDLAVELQKKALDKGIDATERIAKITDVKASYLRGTQSAREFDDLFASQAAAQEHMEMLTARGLSTTDVPHPIFRPTVAKVVYEIDKNLAATNEHVVQAMVYYKQQEQIHMENAHRVTAKWLGKDFEQLPTFTSKELTRINRDGAGAGMLTGANSGYGTPGQVTTQIGKVTANLNQRMTKEVTEELQAPLMQLGTKQEAAIEFSAINVKAQRSTSLLMPYEYNGARGLLDRKLVDILEKEGDISDFLKEGENWIPIKHEETWQAALTHTDIDSRAVQLRKEVNSAYGKTDEKFTGIFRPIRPDTTDYPYYAFVYDPRVTNGKHVAMIHAASDKELAALIDKVPQHFKVSTDKSIADKITVRTKLDIEGYHKAKGDYEFARTLHENYLDGDLKKAGVFSSYFPPTDPQRIVDSVLRYHTRQASVSAKELIKLHYHPVFNMLEDMGDEFSKFSTSKFASRTEAIQKTTDNPYYNYVKNALNISNISEKHLWSSANKGLDEAVSKAYGSIRTAFKGMKSPEELVKINELLDTHGIKPAYYDAALEMYANHTAPRGVLTDFVRKGNSLLSLFTLGLDPLNAVVNAVSANVLRGTELQSLVRAIKQGNTELAGELADLAKLNIPGTDLQMLAPQKLIANAMQAMVKDGAGGPLTQRYRGMGLIKDRVEQLALLVDDYTLKGTETVAELTKREATAFARAKEMAKSAGEFGEKWTGNKLAEEMNRFISANVADQITSLAVKHGIMDERTAQAYINTFVNRVEGTMIASQRPLVFQGPIGQAIGLFQRYQFNLLQQMFRYVSEGSKKDVAMMMGLQSTLFGLQGLPGFQAINTHVVGQLSGNTEHKDFYSHTVGMAGEQAANWLMYGIPSNILQANLYSRGDINPRHLTVLPTSLQETPIVSGWAKLFGSMYEGLQKMAGGGAISETFIQAVEHNGISRPLAGFAQTMQALGNGGDVYSTSGKGGILWSNDLLSWATVMRLAGGRPLDEARVNDYMSRIRVYEASDTKKLMALGETVKTTLIQGNNPTSEQLDTFLASYVAKGGQAENFNRWMMRLYKDANVSQAEQLAGRLKSPYSQQMQLLLGGQIDD